MEIMEIVEFQKIKPSGATHVLKSGDDYKFAWFDGRDYQGQVPMEINAENGHLPNNNFFFRVETGGWAIHAEL